jgi:uncharacterized protein YjiS (DUF1127 family)
MRLTMDLQSGLAVSRESRHAALVASWFRTLLAPFTAWRLYARRHEIAQMSDRELQDIGLTRPQAEALARGLF